MTQVLLYRRAAVVRRMAEKALMLFFPLLAGLAVLFVSCTNDPYETGDDTYSYLRADFVEAYTGSDTCSVVEALTDDGVSLHFQKPIACPWAHVADTMYRALLYYNNVADGPQPLSLVPVLYLRPKPLKADETMHADPILLESVWTSAQGKYCNLGFAVKTGLSDGVDSRHVIGLVPVSEAQNEDGSVTHNMSLYHDRAGVPEYYSSRTYATIPLSGFGKGDTLRLSIPTYDGVITRNIPISSR